MRGSAEGHARTPTRVAALVTIGVFIVLAGRLFSLQIVRGSHYVDLARRNYVVQVALKAPRGDIVDRNGEVIAGSRQSFSICGIPRLLTRDKDEIVALGRILGLDPSEIVLRLSATSASFRPTAVARDVDFATVSRIEEDFADLPDVMVVAEPVRFYPDGPAFAHLVGYIGEVTQDEITASAGSYAVGDLVGRAGLEKTYDSYLGGKDGVKFMKFSVTGGTSPEDVADLPQRSPVRGWKATLYADAGLQRLAETLLAGERGSVIALDVRTGGVLVLASAPAYDPSLFVSGISASDWKALVGSDDKPLLNRAIQSSYPPGSTYKIVTAAAALEGGVVSESSHMGACAGTYRYGNRVFACWNRAGHGSLDLIDAIKVSCDIYFYQLGERVGIDQFYSCSQKWRLNELTGVDLPGEIRGLVPSRAYYDARDGKGKWSKGLMLNLAIGQGEMLVTPMEMVTFVSGIAGWGRYCPPVCLASLESDQGTMVPETKEVTLPVSHSTLDVVRRAMLAVCESPGGTGSGARIEGIDVAGKTGTAQNPHGDDHAWFVCFAPYDDPEIAVCVMLENAGHGGAVGAPIARRLMEHYFHLDQEVPDSTDATSGEVAALD
jgi:penicillin-binding protein 2